MRVKRDTHPNVYPDAQEVVPAAPFRSRRIALAVGAGPDGWTLACTSLSMGVVLAEQDWKDVCEEFLQEEQHRRGP